MECKNKNSSGGDLQMRLVLLISLLLVAFASAWGHADLDVQIRSVTAKIGEQPQSNDLYLKRAELHRLHGGWAAALADYDKAQAIDPSLNSVAYFKARLWLDAERPQLAKTIVEQFLTAQPAHRNGLLLRARINRSLGDHLAAAADFERVIQSPQRARPDLYLEWAREIAALGPSHFEQALRALDVGIDRLGPAVALMQYAIELEQRRGRNQAALARIEKLPERIRKTPSWLARHADLLASSGQTAEAKAGYAEALVMIESLPASRRNSAAYKTTRHHIQAALRCLGDLVDCDKGRKQ